MLSMNRRSFIGAAGATCASAAVSSLAIAEEAGQEPPVEEQEASDWRTAPAPIADELIVETKEADYIVVGAAHAGGAVLRSIAEDSDHSVIGIEKQAHEGFFTMGNDIGHFNSQWLRDKGIEDVDPVVMFNDWMRRGLNAANPSLIMQFCQNCGADIDWYLEPFDDDFIGRLTLPYYQHPESLLYECVGYTYVVGTMRVCTAENPDIDMSIMQQTIYDAILACDNASIDFETTACQLIKDGDRVCGVIAQNADGDYVRYNANLGVVLAAGDFAGNADMRADLLTHITDCFHPGEDWSPIMAQDGSGIQMGVWAGGRMEPRPIACMNGDWIRGNYQAASIWLDTDGRRYCNEFFGEMPFAGKPGARIPHITTWAIADSTLAENVLTTISAHDAFEPSDDNVQSVRNTMENAATEAGTSANAYRADTIEELAALIGYDEEQTANMVASVAEWNACCAAGVDTMYGKDPACLFPIDTPPYYAFSQNSGMIGGLMVTLGGLITNRFQNVLDENCYPIPGLYATGNCCGQRFGAGYFTQTPGCSLGIAITLGRELGKYLAAL